MSDYPYFLRPILVEYGKNLPRKFNKEQVRELYLDFMKHYISEKVFVKVIVEEVIWFKISNKATNLSRTERNFIIAVAANQYGWLPDVCSIQKESDFYKNFAEQVEKFFLLTIRPGKLTEKAERLLNDSVSFSFTVPQVDGAPVPTYLVALLKFLSNQDYSFSFDWKGKEGLRVIAEQNVKADRKYGYSSAPHRIVEFIRYSALYENGFYAEIAPFIEYKELTVRARIKHGSVGRAFSHHKTVATVTSTATLAGTTLAVTNPTIFAISTAVVGTGAVLTSLGYLIAHPVNNKILVVKPEGRKLLKEITAWENLINKTPEPESYVNKTLTR